jgi:hypothetical protein
MAEETQSGFKVTDRRLFNPDGSIREDAIIEEPPAPEPPPLTAAASPFDSSSSPGSPVEPEFDPEGEPEHTMFTEFLMNIASSAFIYLGLVEHPATGRRQVDLAGAKESIDMMVMLREKTKGNLTRGEDVYFEQLLSDLKMQFISLRR